LGKLIVIEGTDGSGKATQTELLCKYFEEQGNTVKRLEFPRYKEESSALVRLYLNGEMGKNPDDVNAYAASTFFAVDRFASYKQDWEKYYNDGGIVITDRYTTSNAVHQAPKLPEDERDSYVHWLFDFEYRLMGLPSPDLVIYLDMPIDITERMMAERRKKTGTTGDIHENDEEYLIRCRNYALKVAENYGWNVISCGENGEPRSISDIHNDIIKACNIT
jgi:dTMP kinase